MKRYGIILLLLLIVFVSEAQDRSDYISKGDEAMKEMNYSLAYMYYDAVVIAVCDLHTIKQLTQIWQENESMRTDMNNSMRRCFSCLDDEAKRLQDTTSIRLLATYYTEGIGTSKNNEMAEYWMQRLDEIRNPLITTTRQNGVTPASEKAKMDFFVGYHASLIAPFGIQFGGMGKTIGWYVRFRSNLIFQDAKYNCIVDKEGGNHIIIQELDDEGAMYRPTGNIKKSVLAGSVGIMYKVTNDMYISTGVGYWDRKYNREFITVNDKGTDIQGTSGWAKDTNRSISDVIVDLDGTYVINGKFFGSLGVSLMSFKYVYPTIGVGVYF